MSLPLSTIVAKVMMLVVMLTSLSQIAFSKELKLQKQIAAGKSTFTKMQCAQCHSVSGRGGCLAPSLDGVTARRSQQYLRLRLTKGAENKFIDLIGHEELLPHPRMNQQSVDSILAYLKTLPKQTIAASPHVVSAEAADQAPANWHPAEITASSREGRRLFYESGCMSCHGIGQLGSDLAPSLNGVGQRHSRKYIAAHITNPQKSVLSTRPSRMPQFDFTPDQIDNIVDFLETIPPNFSPQN